MNNKGKAHTLCAVMQKGGCGKTTLTENIGDCLASMGRSVLFVDLDSQGHLSRIVTGTSGYEHSSYEVLLGKESILENIIEGEIDILPASPLLSSLDADMSKVKRKEFRLKEALGKVQERYDYILIDVPPALGIAQANALTASDGAIIPVQSNDDMGYDMIDATIQTIETIEQGQNSELLLLGFVITLKESTQSNVSKYMREKIAEKANIFNTEIIGEMRKYTAYNEIHLTGRSLQKDYGRTNAAHDMRKITEKIIELMEG